MWVCVATLSVFVVDATSSIRNVMASYCRKSIRRVGYPVNDLRNC